MAQRKPDAIVRFCFCARRRRGTCGFGPKARWGQCRLSAWTTHPMGLWFSEPARTAVAHRGPAVGCSQTHFGTVTPQAGTQTGLDHMEARQFWASMGRFTSPDPDNAGSDPSSPGTWNMYSYAYNNPLMYTDPTGTCGEVDPETGADREAPWCKIYELLRQRWLLESRQTDTSVQFGGIIFGHHGLSNWRKIPKGTDASKFFSKWFTGPLKDRTANYYDTLHRAYNQAVARLAGDYLRSIGKNSLSELTKEEAKQLARQILDSNAPGIRDFLVRLGNGATSILGRSHQWHRSQLRSRHRRARATDEPDEMRQTQLRRTNCKMSEREVRFGRNVNCTFSDICSARPKPTPIQRRIH